MAIEFSIAQHIEVPPVVADVLRADPVVFSKAKGHIGDAFQGLDRMGVVTIGHDGIRSHTGKLVEGFLNICQILEIIQMIRLHIQHHRQSGEEIQEGIAVFAAFQHDGIPVAHPMACMEQRQVATDHHRGVLASLHKNMGHHGGGGSLSMGTGNTNGIFIGLHDFAPGLSPLKHGNAGSPGSCNLRIVVMGSSGADDAVRSRNILGTVADVHMDAMGNELICGHRGAHI